MTSAQLVPDLKSNSSKKGCFLEPLPLQLLQLLTTKISELTRPQ